MELFSVTCTTCQSRLKVRDRGALGQILACPKCQGMVLIEPPTGWVDPGTEVVSAAAPTPQQAVAPTNVPLGNFDDAAALLTTPISTPPEPAAPPMMESWPAEAEAFPPQEWISPAQRMRRWVLLGGLSSIAAAVLIIALVYGLSGGGEKTPDVVQTPAPPVITEESVVEPPPVKDAPKESVDSVPIDEREPLVDETLPAPVDIPPPAKQPVTPNPPLKESSNLPPDLATDEPPANDPKPLNNFNIDDTLKEFGPLIESPPFNVVESAPPDDPATATPVPAVTTPEVVSEEEPFELPEPRKVDVARRLSDPLDAVEIADVPLADFLQFVTDLSTIPITLEPAALPAIKTSTEAKIKVSLKKTTVGDLLSVALAPHHLAFVAREDGIVVLPVASSQAALREIKHDVSDLAATTTEAEALAAHIAAVVDPASWKAAGGFGDLVVDGSTLAITQTPETQFAIVILCEKLRLARKLPTRSSYPASIVTLTPRFSMAQAILDQPLTINFVPPTRLSKVQERLKAIAGLRVLVNWQAIAQQGWTPETEVKIGAANQPLRQFVVRLTQRMGLAYRVIDASTVQITTAADLDDHPDVEVYPLANGNDEVLKALQTTLGQKNFGEEGIGVLRYDSASGTLIARLPQPLQSQLAEELSKL